MNEVSARTTNLQREGRVGEGRKKERSEETPCLTWDAYIHTLAGVAIMGSCSLLLKACYVWACFVAANVHMYLFDILLR